MKKFIIALLSVLIVILTSFLIYTSIYYKAENIDDYLKSSETVEVKKDNNIIEVIPNNYEKTIIFYPGGKVEYTAYAPLLHELANNNIKTILLKMPFNLAVFSPNKAKKYVEENTYIMGHSLGASMAASYYHKSDDLLGLIMLAGYSTYDLSNKNVLSIYGSNDGVLNMEKYNKYKENIKNSKEVVINNGCHSYFGSYGIQKNDNASSVTREDQLKITIDSIIDFIG